MIDPAALSTLIIGLEATRHDTERQRGTRASRIQDRRNRARQRLATTMREMAARLEPVGLPAR